MVKTLIDKFGKSALNVALLWSGTILGAIAAFLTQAIAGRALGPSGYGVFSNSLALVILLAQFTTFGLNTYWLNTFGKDGWLAQRLTKPSLKLLVITCIASSMIYATSVAVDPQNQQHSNALYILLPAIYGFAAVELIASKLQLEERYKALSTLQFSHHLLRLALLAALLASFPNTNKLTLVSASYALVAIGLAIFAAKEIFAMGGINFRLKGHAQRPTQDAPEFTTYGVASGAWLFGIDEFLYIAYFQCSNILLKHLDGDHSAGVFFAAFNIMAAFYLLPSVLYSKFLAAKIQRWAYQDKAKLLNALRIGAGSMLAIGVICTSLIWLLGGALIHILYGAKFAESIRPLLYLSLCAPIRFLSTSTGSILTTKDNIIIRVRIKIVGVAVCLIANFILIPAHGTTGAAIATVITELTILALFVGAITIRFRDIFGEK